MPGWFDVAVSRVKPGAGERALAALRANGFKHSGLDIIGVRTSLTPLSSLAIRDAKGAAPVVDLDTGRKLLNVSTDHGRSCSMSMGWRIRF